ncbi:UDP-3-O-(3-hydroxymyristoyl)glucosamine N-acyltransferase [Cognatishimia sp. SS12]|uniref:UDP-3-O-(3-hydroxymyristoyl)glucosamine N-acyltransferase n=1 Tax=Cognatishimia sp. SS12 TaxID=2979465 RepID=UPI00232AFB4C|nr:UDP-3-O-(3-hydroxymyristoyl)glucosamine N-acyltransferase [Cognatishimia sp. SS12]MDC0737249.1 UDP-3-O-(3-hydroxymyristoyl)glucosamine N-acyltransferase [Cognatishimia sp. SS12]
MAFTIKEIATALGAQAFGAVDLSVARVSEPAEAGADDIALALNPKFADGLTQGGARAAILWDGADWQGFGLEAAITVPRARYAMSGLTQMFDLGVGTQPGIHPSAIIDPTAEIGENVSIGAFTVIEARAKIGDNAVIGPQCYIGVDVTLGARATLRDHVSLLARVTIGDDFWCQSGARIGGDGFSFVTPEKSHVESTRETLGKSVTADTQHWARIHSLGSVSIGDNVEIGVNSTVDRGTIRDTRIGNGVKLDNLVQVGHNVVIGNDCLLCAQVGVAGSTQIGNNVVLGGQTGVADNLVIGDNVVTGGATTVLSNVPSGRAMLGSPAMKMETQIEAYKGLRRLPRLVKEVAALKKAISNLSPND